MAPTELLSPLLRSFLDLLVGTPPCILTGWRGPIQITYTLSSTFSQPTVTSSSVSSAYVLHCGARYNLVGQAIGTRPVSWTRLLSIRSRFCRIFPDP